MPQTVKGVIARAKDADLELVDIVVPDPGPGHVRGVACGAQLARRVRPVPGVSQGRAVVLLRHRQRLAGHDADRRN